MKVTVFSGANEYKIEPEEGTTIAELVDEHGDILTIADGSIALVNGVQKEYGYTMQNGDRIEFSKATGNKA